MLLIASRIITNQSFNIEKMNLFHTPLPYKVKKDTDPSRSSNPQVTRMISASASFERMEMLIMDLQAFIAAKFS
ncbi:hypothetical protein [Alkalihalobacillus sp. TS-13]|uniref:hypothetical protein n=1 Tax=Alkalihalobacillus sp. TS-13 TaxID=2842455 RepID=UPI001C884E17|nr:hypothetical protein [Alkalihalobacillus sp. TS-13]